MTTISVIIPTFNRKGVIGDAIRSVLAQTISVHEIIVVDDGSRDGTEEFVREQFSLPQVRFLRQDNAGAGPARNRGLTVATGEWIAFLDSDDLWRPEKVEHFLRELVNTPDADFFYSETTRSIEIMQVEQDPEIAARKSDVRYLLGSFSIQTSSVLVRSSLVREHGLAFGVGVTCEDYEFFWKAISVSRAVIYSDYADTIYANSADSLMLKNIGLRLLNDNVKAIENVISWMSKHEINVTMQEELRVMGYWQIRDAAAAMILYGNYKDLLCLFLRAGSIYGHSRAVRVVISAVRHVLSRHNRTRLRSYGLKNK